jgi:Fe-S-cluster containining protein
MTTIIPLKPAAKVKITPENKCSFCKGSTCCTYLTQELDAPRSMEDFDLLLWQVSHANTQIYKDEDGWFLLVNNRCLHLQDDGRCGIYHDRPQICRDHSNDECEFDGPCGKDDFKLFFPDYATLLKYCRKKFKNWDRRLKTAAPDQKPARKKPRPRR